MSPSTLAWRPEHSKKSGEKRRDRSDDPTSAAIRYLDGVRRRCLLDALLLADREGRVLASAPGAGDLDTLAAAGAAITRGDTNAGVDGVDVYAHRVEVAGSAAVLVSSGSRVDRVRVVAADLDRILG